MSQITIQEAFDKYRSDFIIMSNQSNKTEQAYANTCLLLIRYMGNIKVTSITFEMIRDWKNWMAEWQQPNTIRGNIICLRMVLKFLLVRDEDCINYDRIPVPKRQKRTVKYLKLDEVIEFISLIGRSARGYKIISKVRNKAIAATIFATGLRVSELCALDRDTIKKDLTFSVVGKSRDPRPGYINKWAMDMVNDYLALRNDNNKALFISPETGERITTQTVRELFRNTCKHSNDIRFDNIHPHTLRHSYATFLLSQRVDLLYISKLMGHSDLNTTKIYTHFEDPQLKEVHDLAFACMQTN